MSTELYIIDTIIISIIAISALIGFYRGIIISLLYFFGLFVNIALSILSFPIIKPFLAQKISDPDLIIIAGYTMLFIAYFILIGVIFFLLKIALKPFSRGVLDRLCGLIFGSARGAALILAVLLVSLYGFSVTHGINAKEQSLEEFIPKWFQTTKSYPYVLQASQISLSIIPDKFEEVLSTWYDDISKTTSNQRFTDYIVKKLKNNLSAKELEEYNIAVNSKISHMPESAISFYSLKKLYDNYVHKKEQNSLMEESLSEYELSKLSRILGGRN